MAMPKLHKCKADSVRQAPGINNNNDGDWARDVRLRCQQSTPLRLPTTITSLATRLVWFNGRGHRSGTVGDRRKRIVRLWAL